jgi:hypothetical protein
VVERQLPKLNVVGSIPITRSRFPWFSGLSRCAAAGASGRKRETAGELAQRGYVRLTMIGLAAALSAASHLANAAVLTATSAAGINDSGTRVGSHFHVDPGSVAGVNTFFVEEGRGVAEFDLTGVESSFTSATLSFRVNGFSDKFTSNMPYTAPITLVAYQGNNVISIPDYDIVSFASIETFATAGLAINDVLSFDITDELAVAVGSIGIRWQGAGGDPTWFSTITFNEITITTSVPEPGSLALLAAGLLGLGALRRRLKAACNSSSTVSLTAGRQASKRGR